MSLDDQIIPTIPSRHKIDPERAKSQLLSPNPNRVKFITELLAALAENRISFASVMNMDRKKIKQLAEQGYVKLRFGRYEEARKIFEVLSFIDHKNYFYHLALGGAYQKLKMFLDAAFQYTECLKYDNKNTNALVNRGEIFLRHRNYKKAAEDFRAAIQNDVTGKDIFSNRARSLVIAIKRTLAKKQGAEPKLHAAIPGRKKVKPSILLGRPGKNSKRK